MAQDGTSWGQVVVRDGIYVREEVLMLVVRLPTAGLQVSTQGQGTAVAYAFQEQEMNSLGCWDTAGTQPWHAMALFPAIVLGFFLGLFKR